jgi:ribonucleoside-diphosphate reductase alpha chain
MTHGVMNSLLVAPMPTASTAQILGNNECFEPITSNIYVRRTLAGEFVLMNKYLQEDLESLHIWNNDLKNSILEYDGSVQHLKIPQIIKDTYKTVWEISQRVLIDLAADRGKFICQSQSLNLFVKEAKFNVITSMLFHAWKVGLKTGVYYLRTRPQSKAQSFTIAPKEEPVCESCSG